MTTLEDIITKYVEPWTNTKIIKEKVKKQAKSDTTQYNEVKGFDKHTHHHISSPIRHSNNEYCELCHSSEKVVQGPLGIKWICEKCQAKLKEKEKDRTKTPVLPVEEPVKPDIEYVVIRMLQSSPIFTAVDGNNYLLHKEDVAMLPKTNAEVFIRRKIAKLINVGV